jgi:hypothetical protein
MTDDQAPVLHPDGLKAAYDAFVASLDDPGTIIVHDERKSFRRVKAALRAYLRVARGRESEPSADQLAELFHETYERLAPHFGYETRSESAKPWVQVPEQNRRLMTAVCAIVLGTLRGSRGAPVEGPSA